MNFTRETPTKPGAYWWRVDEKDWVPNLIEVKKVGRKLMALEAGVEGEYPLTSYGGLWSEPLEPRCYP